VASFAATAAAFRFYEDGTESGSAAIAAQDTNIVDRVVSSDSQVQLRYRIDESGSGNVDGGATDDYGLEIDINTAGFNAVTASSTGVKADTGSTLTDGAATTDRATEGISAGAGSFVVGESEAANGVIEDWQLTGNDHGEVVWAVILVAADLSEDDSIDFRVTYNGGSPGMTNSVTPNITITKAADVLMGQVIM